jgi:hypothetical protein
LTQKPIIKQFKYLSKFKCLADKCPDNCCYGWSISVDEKTYEIYKDRAPEMLDFIDETKDGCRMKKDPAGSENCIKLENGLCGIESTYGPWLLSNTCFLFPRVRSYIGGTMLLSAELSCPEIARLCLYGDDPFSIENGTMARLPATFYNLVKEGDSEENIFNVSHNLINFCGRQDISAEQVILKIKEIAEKLDPLPRNEWPDAVSSILAAEIEHNVECTYDEIDFYKILTIITQMLHAAKRINRKRLKQALANIESVLQVKIDIESPEVSLGNNSVETYKKLCTQWQSAMNKDTRALMKRYIQADLALNLFPYGKSKRTLHEQSMILAFKFAFIKLALVSYIPEDGVPLTQDTILKVIQGISRYLNHVGDFELMLSICREFGWFEKSDFAGLLYSYPGNENL